MIARDIAIGLGSGLLATFLTFWIGRPRVAQLSFAQHPTAVGTMYDAVFRLNRWGWMDPGTCTLTVGWPQGSTFAKWNETPEPVSQGTFHPESVPATFYRPVTARESFDVPILVEPTNGRLEVFSGWWYGWPTYGSNPAVQDADRIALTLRGSSGLLWQGEFTVATIRAGRHSWSWFRHYSRQARV
jgi:hypothetical protein